MDNTTAPQAIEETDAQVQHIKGVIESLLFVNERPVTLDQIKKVLEAVNANEIKKAIAQLQLEYEARSSGMMVVEIAGGYQMLSNPAYAAYLRSFYKTKHKEKLSKPALECLAIIAYRQPVTRADIEVVRGVNSDGVVAHLLDKELIKAIGRKDVPGRPYVYGTTKQFQEYFGLKSLDDLPVLEEFPALEPAEANILPLTDEEAAAAGTQPPETRSTDHAIRGADAAVTASEALEEAGGNSNGTEEEQALNNGHQ